MEIDDLDGPRPLRQEELPALVQLIRTCFPGAGVVEASQAYVPPRRGGMRVICHQGVPVCHIGVTHSQVNVCGSPLKVASIGGVCTHPDYRAMGLATRLLDYCMRELAADGARLVLISGMRGLYTQAGCVAAQNLEYITLKPDRLQPGTGRFSLRPAGEADVPLLARLYQAEPVHFVRRVEEFSAHFWRPEEFPKGGDWMVEQGGRPVAYLFTSIPWEHWHQPGAGVREVVEYAGSRVALVEALGETMAQMDLRELRVFVPWQDEDLLQPLRGQGVTGDHLPLFGHTMRIVNLSGLMADLRPYVRARLPERLWRGLRFEQEGEQTIITWRRERLELDGAVLTRLVMGIPVEMACSSDFSRAQQTTEVVTTNQALDEIIPALFPLPSFLPGLNYR